MLFLNFDTYFIVVKRLECENIRVLLNQRITLIADIVDLVRQFEYLHEMVLDFFFFLNSQSLILAFVIST